MAPLWHWGLTAHHCGIIVHFQPHEQKQGPEPPAVGTRGQRTPRWSPVPPPSGPRGDLGHPDVCRRRVRSCPHPISREGSRVFWPDTHGPTSPHGVEMLPGGRGHTQLMGRGLHICTSPPLPSSSSSSLPPNYLTWRLRRFGDTPGATSAVPLTPGAGGRGDGAAGGVEQSVALPGEQDPAQLCCSHPAAEPAQGLGHICFGARGEP